MCLLSVLATTRLPPVTCDCDSVSWPEETPPPPLPQHSQSCQGPFPVLLKVSLGEKFAGLEHVVRTEPSSVVVSRCSGHCTAGYHSVCRGTNTNIRSVLTDLKSARELLIQEGNFSLVVPKFVQLVSKITIRTGNYISPGIRVSYQERDSWCGLH